MWRTVLAALALVASVAPGAAAHPNGPSGCGATAPLTIQCSTGWHLFDAEHDQAAIDGSTYTGTVESRIDWFNGHAWTRCSFTAGVLGGCDNVGAGPDQGTPVYHTCTSYLVPVVHGGIGEYGCTLY